MEKKNLKSVIGGYVLRIPDYQRGYAWERSQWDDFVEDIDALIDEDVKSHYTGTVVLYVPRENQESIKYGIDRYPVAEIIDGQQRLTTIMLYLSVIMQKLIKNGEIDYKDMLSEYVYKNGQCRLILNNNTETLFYELVSTGLPKTDATTSHQHRLIDAYNYLSNHVAKCEKDRLAQLYEVITRKLHFSSYVIDEPSEVGMTFELMNSRGKRLTDLELLKNYLMYWVYRNAKEDEKTLLTHKINNSWKYVYCNLHKEGEEFQCLRTAWILLCSYTPKDWDDYNGFKANEVIPIRDFTKRPKDKVITFIIDFTDTLSLISKYYAIILQSEQKDAKETEWLSKIKRAGNIANFIPLIVVAKMKLESGDIKKQEYISLLQSIEKYIYRVFMWEGKRSNAGLTNFYRWSYELYSSLWSISQIIKWIDNLCVYYSPEKEFIDSCNKLSSWYGSSNRILKYTLFEYELHLLNSEGKGATPRIKWEDICDATLEHILPQNPCEGSMWLRKWSDEEREKYKHDICNIVLTQNNSNYLNFDFVRKKGTAGAGYCYANSDIRQERKISEYSDWTPSESQKRKEILSEWICERWGVHAVESEQHLNIDEDDE